MFHGGMQDTFVMYLSDYAALVCKNELVEKLTGWKNEEAPDSEDLMLHDINKPKSNKRDIEKNAPEDYAASGKEVDKASSKKSKKSKRGEDASSDSNSELDAWTANKLLQ